MQTRISLLSMVICYLSWFAAFGQQRPLQIPGDPDRVQAEKKLGMITGRVVDASSEHPLAKVTLSLRSAGASSQSRPRTARTDLRGRYEFGDVEAGKYVLRASRRGYIAKNYGQKANQSFRGANGGTSLALAAGEVLKGADFNLLQGGVVEGRVVDQDKQPLSRISVVLSGYRSMGSGRRMLPVGRDETDDRGRFRLFDIPPGNYYLSGSPNHFYSRGRSENRSFPPTYYPGVLNVEEASKIEVTAGGEVGGFHLTLIESFSYSVSGRVLTPEGRPARSVWIVSMKASNQDVASMIGPSANTNLEGEFTVPGLLPGRHRLFARTEKDGDFQMASATVDLADQDLRGLTLVLAEGAEVTGSIVADGQDLVLDWRRVSLAMRAVGNARMLSSGRAGSQIEEDFTFRISDLPEGLYRFSVKLPPGNHYVSSIRVQGQDVSDRSIEMKGNDRLDGVEIHVSSDGGQISGVVKQNEAREVVEGATVLVFAADSQYRGRYSRFTKTAQTDQRGRFLLRGLVPAEYVVCALTDHESGRESEPEYLRSLEKDSEEITVSSGDSLEGTLVALPAPEMN